MDVVSDKPSTSIPVENSVEEHNSVSPIKIMLENLSLKKRLLFRSHQLCG
jgi:hypothetical protein